MYRKVFLAYDPSGLADRAIPALIGLAGGSGAEVLLLSVRDDYNTVENVRGLENRMQAAAMRLESAGLKVLTELHRVYRESIAEEVLRSARGFDPDLVVMGSRGHGDLAGLLLHSVAHKLTAALSCPVVVVPGGDAATPNPVSRILLALDGTRESMAALRAAKRVAREHHAAVKIVHVFESIAYGDGFGTAENDVLVAPMLQRAAGLLDGSASSVSTEAIAGSPVAKAIAGAADQWDADLIVVGSRRHGSAGALLLGSVAHGVMARTHRPVLVAEKALRTKVKAGENAKVESYPGLS